MIGCTLMLLWYYLEHQCTIYTRTSTTIQPAKTQQYAAASYLGCQYVPSHPQPLLSYYTDCVSRLHRLYKKDSLASIIRPSIYFHLHAYS
ncbi:hypothetical protein QQG55_42265 [Brugia pahangi]